MIDENSSGGDSATESSEEISKRENIPPVIRRQHKSNLGSRIISNPKLMKSLNEEEELERLNKRISFTPSIVNSKRTSTYIYCEPDEDEQKKIEINQSWRKYLGIILALAASIVLATSSLLVKIIPHYHPYSVVVWTFQGIFLPSIPILVYHRCIKKEHFFTNNDVTSAGKLKLAFFLLSRGLLGSGGVVLRIYSLQYMTMGDSTVIAFSSPIFVVIMAWLLLDEKCGAIPILAALTTLVGVGLITRPPLITGEEKFDTNQLIGAAMSLGCMLLGTFAVIILRYIRHVHFALVTMVYGLIGTIVGLLLTLTTEDGFEFPDGVAHWFCAVGIAFLTFVGQSLLTVAFKFEQAGPISLVRTSEIIVAFLLEFMVFGKVPHWLSLIGALIVMGGVITITIRKWVDSLPENHNSRKTCWLILK